jgi:error-prone DNA polymerase
VEADGRVRLGLMYVNGLRQDAGKAIASAGRPAGADRPPERHMPTDPRLVCPKCGGDDPSMIEPTPGEGFFCNVCAYEWRAGSQAPARSPVEEPRVADEPRFSSIEDLIARTGIRRDELSTLAAIGALNAFGHDRRSALWQIEKAIRPAGELYSDPARRTADDGPWTTDHEPSTATEECRAASREPRAAERSPLRPMTPPERLMADYAGTSLTIGPHPMALRRAELALRGVLRAIDLPRGRHGRRVRVAGAVITRQRPGTAKGFVFLTLEDETGIANIIVRPDLFSEQKTAIVGAPYLLVEGTLQIQEGVTSVKAERVVSLAGGGPDPQSHDFR